MAWNIGANDVANSMACAVGSKALTIFWAVILAGICEFAGAVLVGTQVTDTIRKGIIDTQSFANGDDYLILAHGMLCAMLAAALWLNVASYFGMPVSTTHSIVGAIVGFGIIQAGFSQIEWWMIVKIVGSWFISPITGGLLAFIIFKLISRNILAVERPLVAARKGVPVWVFVTFFILILATIYKGLKNLVPDFNIYWAVLISMAGGGIAALIAWVLMQKVFRDQDDTKKRKQLLLVEKIFVPLVIISSCTVAFAHGANDVANAVGPLQAVVEIVQTKAVPEEVEVELWVLMLGGVGIVFGLATFGYRVMRLVGTRVTQITPTRGIAADLATMATVLTCSKMGLPISTTHTLIGAILGVGMARGITAINRQVVKSIFTSWLITVPIAAVLTIVLYLIGNWLFW
ncbi:MAG: inorganic phosphate transporter [Planctomycetes bacterium]|nr:inorganic phosphate transporter [Planctomycetota bacterium]